MTTGGRSGRRSYGDAKCYSLIGTTSTGRQGLICCVAVSAHFGMRCYYNHVDWLRLIIRQGMTVTSIGIVVGLAAALVLTRLLETLLFGISATDWVTYAEIVTLLSGVALLACYLPARRASQVDPMVALRQE